MSSKVMDVISGIQSVAPIRKVHPSPRDRPIYGRPGVTMGQHLDDFRGFKDDHGRSFDQLIFSALHKGARASTDLPKSQGDKVTTPKPVDGKVAPSQEKTDMDAYMHKLKYGHLDEVRKRMVKPERKRKLEDEAQKEDKKQKTGPGGRSTKADVTKHTERKKPGLGSRPTT